MSHRAESETPVGGGPGFRLRRERLGEWAVTLVLALAVGLWRLWPRGNYLPRPPAPLPEPALAYVELVSGGTLLQQGNWLAGSSPLTHSPETLPLLPQVALPPLATPAYSEPLSPQPDRLPLAPPLLLPLPLPQCETLAPAAAVPEAWRGRRIYVAPALRAAGFGFTVPQVEESGAAGRRLYRIALDESGRVVGLLDESERQSAGETLWRRALLSGSGTNSASGTILIEWR